VDHLVGPVACAAEWVAAEVMRGTLHAGALNAKTTNAFALMSDDH
jgi:hypothetical protein